MFRIFFALLLGLVLSSAHDPGSSTATVDLGTREILVQCLFAQIDLEPLGAEPLTAARIVEIRGPSESLPATFFESRPVGTDTVEFTMRFPRPPGPLAYRALAIERLALGHRQAISVRDEAGTTVSTDLLAAGHDTIDLPTVPPPQTPPRKSWALITVTLAALAAIVAWRMRSAPTAAA